MANRKPLVLNSGEPQQIQSGDTLVDGSGNPIGGGGFITAISAKSANFTVITGDKGTLFQVTTGASTITATLPAAATAGANWCIFLEKADTGTGAITTSPTALDATIFALMEQYDIVMLYTDGTNYYANAFPSSIDATLIQPPISENDYGASITVPDTGILTQPNRLTNSGTDRVTAAGTARIIVGDTNRHPLQAPNLQTNFTIKPDEYVEILSRISINTSERITLMGNARLVVQDYNNSAGIIPGIKAAQITSFTATTSGNYVVPIGTKFLIVEAVGAGGGGGGAAAASANVSVGGGGGSGAYARVVILFPLISYTYSVGAGGVANSGAGGGTGGDTSFGFPILAKGGSGGGTLAAGTTFTAVAPGNGGSAASCIGDLIVGGSRGEEGIRLSGTQGWGGIGAASFFGQGARSVISGNIPGINADTNGAGGGGGATVSGSTAVAGGVGGDGALIITAYF